MEGVSQDRMPRALPNATNKIVGWYPTLGHFLCESKDPKEAKKNRAFLTRLAKIEAEVGSKGKE